MTEPKAQRPEEPPAVVDFAREHEGLLLVYRSSGVTAIEGGESRGRRELVHALVGHAVLMVFGMSQLALGGLWWVAVPAVVVAVGLGTWKILRAVRCYREMWLAAEVRGALAERRLRGGP